jgi:hypothetical protein
MVSLAVVLGLCTGCYDGAALVNQARSAALNTRLAEVDLGFFRTTLPRDPNSASLTELEFHIFGTAPRYHVPAIEKQLKADEFRVRHGTIAAVRRSTRDELAEPNLSRLRSRIERVINSVLEDAPVKSIGFYEVTLHDM